MKDLQEKNVRVGQIVTIKLKDRDANVEGQYTFKIIREEDYDPKSTGQVTTNSPLGKALISKKIGDSGKYDVCGHYYEYQILLIKEDNQQRELQNRTTNILTKKYHK